jgi:cleavage stimulation factor subunit 3
MADYDPASVGDETWNGEQGFDGADDEQQEPSEHSTDQDENQANYSLDQSKHAPGDSTPFDGATDEVGDYDPASVTATNHAPDPQPQTIPKPTSQPVAKKPRTAGGFLVGDSDSEDDDDDNGPLSATNGTAVGAKSQALVPPSPLRRSVTARPSEDDASNAPAQVNAVAPAAVLGGGRGGSSAAPMSAQPHNNPSHDGIKFLEDRVLEDPRGAVAEWLALMAHYRAKNDISQARQLYDRFLDIFPQAVRFDPCPRNE